MGVKPNHTDKRSIGSKATRLCFWAVISIAFVAFAFILFLQLESGLSSHSIKTTILLFLALLVIGGVFYYIKLHGDQKIFSTKNLKILLVISLVFGVVLRLAFLGLSHEYIPNGTGSDTGIHWYAGQEILATGQIQTEELGIYEAYFPYLTTYTAFISMMMKIFGVRYLAILLPNVLADLLVCVIIYYLLKHWRGQKFGLLGASLWIANPLGIAFCVQGLALSITNLFIAIVLLLVYLLWQSLKSAQADRTLTLAALLGLTLSVGNNIRGVFSVFLIAVTILIIVRWFTHHNLQESTMNASLLLTTFAFFLCGNAVMTQLHYALNPYYESSHGTIGWSFYVGANYDSKGRWSFEDWETLPPRLYGGEMSLSDINSAYLHEGLVRYQEMGLARLGVHAINKTRMLFTGNEVTLIRNLEEQFTGVDGSEGWYWLLNDTALFTISLLVALSFVYFWQIIKNRKIIQIDYFAFFLSLCFCGLLASSLLVEVMSRYVSVFLVLLVIFAACAIGGSHGKQLTIDDAEI